MAVWDDILTAVRDSVASVASAPAVARKSGETLPGDSFPMWLICAAGEEKPRSYAFTGLVEYVYPVAVLYLSAHDRDFDVNGALLTERQTVREQLDQRTLSGASTVIDAELTPLPVTTYQENNNTTYDVTGFGVDYTSWETRTNG